MEYSLFLSKNHKIYGCLLKLSYLLLLIWETASELLFGKSILIIKIIPIIVCLKGILYLNTYMLQWGLITLHLYLLEGIVSFTSSQYPFNLFGGVTLCITIMTYMFSLLYLKPYKKYQKQQKQHKK